MNLETHPTVIVRAFDGEPVVLLAHGEGSGGYVRVTKAGVSQDRCIGIPPDDVFQYDDWSFTKLKRAYDTGDKGTLMELYAQTPLLYPPTPQREKKDLECVTCGQIVPRKMQWRCAGRAYHEQCFPQELLPAPARDAGKTTNR